MATAKKARLLRMLFCDFCGRSHEVCELLIQGRDEVHICDVCVNVCAEMVLSQHKKDTPTIVGTEGAE